MTTDPYAAHPFAGARAEQRRRPRRERVPYPAPPSWLPLAALGTGVAAGVAIPNNAPGLGWVLAIGAIAASVLPVVRRSMRRDDLALCALLAGLLLMFVLRGAEWLHVLDLLAVAVVGTVVLAGARTWEGMVTAGATIWVRLAPALPYVLRPLTAKSRTLRSPRARSALKGAALTVLLLVVFGALFASADAAFASLVSAAIPEIDLAELPAYVVVGTFAAALVGAGQLTHLRPITGPPLEPPAGRPRAEWAVPVLALDALFATFVVVQLTVLFGGNDHVLSTGGLTYAQYARQGFFQLVAVALLTLGVVAFVARRVSPDDARDRLLARASLGTLCGLTLVVLLSALRRIALYEAAYGLTRLRLLVHATIFGIALVVLLVVAAGVRWNGSWLPRACLAVAAATLLGLNVANPDLLIARRGVAMLDAGKDVDVAYLTNLGADAVPLLVTLPERDVVCEWNRGEDGLLGWNVARSRARAACRRYDQRAVPERRTAAAATPAVEVRSTLRPSR